MVKKERMLEITLARPWTDTDGVEHPRGSVVSIPEDLLDDLVAEGFVAWDVDDEGSSRIRWA